MCHWDKNHERFQIAKLKIWNYISLIQEMSSEYEQNVSKLLAEKQEMLDRLKKDPQLNKEKIETLLTEIETLESLYENYNLGLSYFRRAKGGRSGLRE